ncbi:MAG: DUF3552 domain-containing protein, partial [Bdellovibrionales bacterium]|nr:DUF3552 domain-containing protein [Bdellovibrionales bacterium]
MQTQILIIGVISIVTGFVLGAGILHVYSVIQGNKKKEAAQKEAERIVNRAKSQVAKIERDSKAKAKDFETRARKNVENDIRKQKQKIQQLESSLKDKENQLQKEYKRKEEELDVKFIEIQERDERLKIAEERIKKMESDTSEELDKLQKKLENIASLTVDQAREELKVAVEDEAHKLAAEQID